MVAGSAFRQTSHECTRQIVPVNSLVCDHLAKPFRTECTSAAFDSVAHQAIDDVGRQNRFGTEQTVGYTQHLEPPAIYLYDRAEVGLADRCPRTVRNDLRQP